MVPSFGLISSIILVLLVALVHAQNDDLWPAAYPLAVRSPYLQAWQTSINGSQPLSSQWPSFWTSPNQVGTCLTYFECRAGLKIRMVYQVLGWAGHIRVDNVTYRWLGADAQAPDVGTNLTGRLVTPTRTTFFVQAGPMNLNVTFLSPIEVRDSTPRRCMRDS